MVFALILLYSSHMPDRPIISVIIPVYNEERTVASIIEVVRTWGNTQDIIVVNDGSTDKTLAAVEQFRHTITILSRKENKGKGWSLVEGVRHARGELLMFLDGDLVGLTHRDLDRMIEPILTNKADMLIAVTNCWGLAGFEPFNDINGERVLWKSSIAHDLDAFMDVGNGVEFVINDLHKDKRVKTIKLPYVYILRKVEKAPQAEAMKQYVKEAGQFLRAIVQIQTDDLTPQAKRVFRVAQSYIRIALEYFQYP